MNTSIKKKEREKVLLKFHWDFYKRFRIPWWLFIANTLMGFVNTELALKLASILIRVNKGELYNSVIISYVLLYVLNSVLAWIQNLFYDYGANKVILRARYVLWKHILHLPVKEIEREQPSSLISATVNDTGAASQTIGYIFLMVNALYSFMRACYTLYDYNASLSLYMLLAIPVAVLVFWGVGKTEAYSSKKLRVALNEMTMYFSEHLSAAKYVKAVSMEDKELQSGYEAIERRYRAGVVYSFVLVAQQLMFSTYRNIVTIMIAVFGSDMIRKGEMEDTGITDFSTYMNKVDEYTSLLLTDYSVFKGSRATLGRVGALLDMPVEDPEKGEAWKETADKDIVFEDVCFGYTEGIEVLHGVSLRIPAGKTTAIIGDNGGGKSTLLKLMQGFYLPDSGTITVAGNQVGQVKLHDLRGQFGYVLQNSELFAASLRDNMIYGVKEEVSDEYVEKIGRMACLDEFAATLEEGYHTMIGESGNQLSGGQRQRIAIARAMIQNPEYLLLDEAGSALDYRTYERIQSAIRQQMQGKTTVFIAHDMREILTADYVIVMDQGSVEAAGTHEQLRQTSAIYRDYLSRVPGKEAVG